MSPGLRARCTVLFADLRGSTGLYERLGNSAAAGLVTETVKGLASIGVGTHGRVVKTLGDGLMALFTSPQAAVDAALRMQAMIAKGLERGSQVSTSAHRSSGLRLHVAMEHGEVVELGDDIYGDAVNVAARLLDHSGDQEILVTRHVLEHLDEPSRDMFRSLDAIVLRGREQPVSVFTCAATSQRDGPDTGLGRWEDSEEPDGIRLWSLTGELVLGLRGLPALLGRGAQAQFLVNDASTSRSHAQLEWRGQSLQLTDLSSNGTHVRFSDGELVTLRRSSCVLHGRGQIGLGRLPEPGGSATVDFELIRFGRTLPAP
ncbi:MAG: adenylate/guanylate cyclase domain-containing protein [Betaproteobacteria bacterium]